MGIFPRYFSWVEEYNCFRLTPRSLEAGFWQLKLNQAAKHFLISPLNGSWNSLPGNHQRKLFTDLWKQCAQWRFIGLICRSMNCLRAESGKKTETNVKAGKMLQRRLQRLKCSSYTVKPTQMNSTGKPYRVLNLLILLDELATADECRCPTIPRQVTTSETVHVYSTLWAL
jgi:hypothetical protein